MDQDKLVFLIEALIDLRDSIDDTDKELLQIVNSKLKELIPKINTESLIFHSFKN